VSLRTARISASILCLSAGIAPHAIHAQAAPLVVEVRAGASIPFGDFASGSQVGEGVAPGPSFGVRLAMSGSGRRTLFGGFSQHRFACEDAGCRAGSDFVATGVDAGLQVNLVTRGSVVPWLRFGGLTTRVESPGLAGSPEGVSSLGWGGEVGLGVYLGATSSVALNPGIRVVAVNTELPEGSVIHMRYVVADLGLALAF
jgi:hypothetical protein